MTDPKPDSPEAIREALAEAWLIMNYMGDILNSHDMTTERDEAISTPIFARIRALAPEICKADVYEILGARYVERIGDCKKCLAPINWHEPRELLPGGTVMHVGPCPPPKAAP